MMALWTFAETTTHLWWDASDDTTISDDGTFTIADKSGNSRDGSQATAANKPAVSSGTLNGLDVLRFLNNDWLTVSNFSGVTGAAAAFLVVKVDADPPTNGTYSGLWHFTGDVSSSKNTHFPYTDNNIYDSFGTTARKTVGNPTPSMSSWRIYYVESSAGLFRVFLDDAQIYSTSTNTVGWPTTPHFGASTTFEHFLNGYAAELVLLPLPSDELRQIGAGYLAHKWGIEGNLDAAHPYKSSAPTIAAVLRVGLNMPFRLSDTIRSGLSCPFRLTDAYRTGLKMPFGAVLRFGINLPFGTADMYRAGLKMPIGYARPHRLGLQMPIEYTSTIRAGLAMPFGLLQSHRVGLSMPFGMVETIRSGLKMPFELTERDTLRSGLRMPFGFEPGAGGVYSDAVSITRDRDGAEISAHYIRTKYHRDDSYIDGELRVSRQMDFLKCPRGTLLTITYNGEEEHVMVDHAYRQRPELTDGSYQVEYVVSLTSASEKLDAPWARPLLTVLGPGMASAIATALAAAEGVTLTWSMIDEFIPADTLYANNETAGAVIKKLAGAWGGCMQTEPDGTVEVVPYYPTSVNRWGGATPDLYLSDYDNVNSMSETPDPRPGYNAVRVMDTLTPQASATLDYDVISATEQIIRRRKVPYNAAETVTLSCSRPDRVTIEPLGLQVDQIDEELVAIESGTGSTRYPIYAVLDKEYGDIQLGTITHSEDGTIQTEVTGQSLVLITYTTRALAWRCRSDILDNVQFWTEVE